MPEVPWDARPVFHPKMLAVGPPAVIYPRDAARAGPSQNRSRMMFSVLID
jgi:hypothetical protein